jgi:hypothetical protein
VWRAVNKVSGRSEWSARSVVRSFPQVISDLALALYRFLCPGSPTHRPTGAMYATLPQLLVMREVAESGSTWERPKSASCGSTVTRQIKYGGMIADRRWDRGAGEAAVTNRGQNTGRPKPQKGLVEEASRARRLAQGMNHRLGAVSEKDAPGANSQCLPTDARRTYAPKFPQSGAHPVLSCPAASAPSFSAPLRSIPPTLQYCRTFAAKPLRSSWELSSSTLAGCGAARTVRATRTTVRDECKQTASQPRRLFNPVIQLLPNERLSMAPSPT